MCAPKAVYHLHQQPLTLIPCSKLRPSLRRVFKDHFGLYVPTIYSDVQSTYAGLQCQPYGSRFSHRRLMSTQDVVPTAKCLKTRHCTGLNLYCTTFDSMTARTRIHVGWLTLEANQLSIEKKTKKVSCVQRLIKMIYCKIR